MTVAKAKVNVSNLDKRISRKVASQIPAHYKESDSAIVKFIEAYYRWMEQKDHILADTYQLTDYQNHRKTEDEFWNLFRYEFLNSIPTEVMVDSRLLLEHIKDFYQARGSEQSFKFLFRILYNVDVELSYPKDNILRTSDGVWQKKIYLKCQVIDEQTSEFPARKIYGTISGATALVESVTFEAGAQYNVAILEISNLLGTFYSDEPIETRDVTNHNLVSRILGQVSSYIIENGGAGYQVGDAITAIGGGDDFFAFVENVSFTGAITKIRFQNTGAGYDTSPTANIIGSGTGAIIRLNASGIYFSPGEYLDDRSQPSSTSRLQDGRFYQEYSYVIESPMAYSEYSEIIQRLVHPAGMKGFGYVNGLGPDGKVTVVGKVLFHLSHPEDANYDDPNHVSTKKFFEPEIQVESHYVTIDDLKKQYPQATLDELFDIFINVYWSIVTPRGRPSTRMVDYSQTNHTQMAKTNAITFLDLYDESNILPYGSMIIGNIEPWTGYPNPRGSTIIFDEGGVVETYDLLATSTDKLIINSSGDFLRVTN